MITIGIGPHKSSLTAVAMNASGESVAEIRVAVAPTMVGQLQEWAVREAVEAAKLDSRLDKDHQ
jgi:hypothetical protein